METQQLILRDFGGVPEITPDAWELKRKALALAKPVARVETPEEQITALNALRELKAVLSGMESTRKAVKAPVLDLGKKIDALAHGFTEEIERQYGRLSGLINHYQKLQLREKREQEQELTQQQATAADLRKQAKELREEAERLTDQAEVDSARSLNDKATKLEEKAFDLEMTTEVAVVPVTDKPKGLVVRNRINFQIMNGLDAIVFCQAWPQFWRWDKEREALKLDRLLVLEELNKENGKGLFHMTRFPEELSTTDDPRLVQPAGLRVYEETKAHIR